MLRYVLAPVHARSAEALAVPRTVPVTGNDVALTFDDGPHPEGTPAILEILAAYEARATFFVIGEQVRRRPELLRRMLGEGHAVALHGDRHRLQLRLGARALRDDVERGLGAIEDATGITPTRHRPPYGIYSAGGLAAARERGLSPLLWATWGKDWRRLTTPTRIARRALDGLRAGDVILLHDADFYSSAGSHERTARALRLILAELNLRRASTVLAV